MENAKCRDGIVRKMPLKFNLLIKVLDSKSRKIAERKKSISPCFKKPQSAINLIFISF